MSKGAKGSFHKQAPCISSNTWVLGMKVGGMKARGSAARGTAGEFSTPDSCWMKARPSGWTNTSPYPPNSCSPFSLVIPLARRSILLHAPRTWSLCSNPNIQPIREAQLTFTEWTWQVSIKYPLCFRHQRTQKWWSSIPPVQELKVGWIGVAERMPSEKTQHSRI